MEPAVAPDARATASGRAVAYEGMLEEPASIVRRGRTCANTRTISSSYAAGIAAGAGVSAARNPAFRAAAWTRKASLFPVLFSVVMRPGALCALV